MNKSNTGKDVEFTLGSADRPTLSETTKARLARMRDEDIDLGDIPASPMDAEWTHGGLTMATDNKRQVTLRLDADVLDYFRKGGKRYQTRINHVLRAFMQSHKNKG